MKKKIINGILMVALVAATSTSFVSCKDNSEDVRTDLLAQLNLVEGNYKQADADLNSALRADLATKQSVADLEKALKDGYVTKEEFEPWKKDVDQNLVDLWNALNDTEDPASVASKLAAINDAIEGEGGINDQIADINKELEDVNDKIKDIQDRLDKIEESLENLITSVTVNATSTSILANSKIIPGINMQFLGAAYGKTSKAGDFPSAEAGDYVANHGVVLDASDIKGVKDDDKISWEAGDNLPKADAGKAPAGTVYFTVNPSNIDASNIEKVGLSLIQSNKEASFVTIGTAKESTETLTWGITRGENSVQLWEAPAEIDLKANDLATIDPTKIIDFKDVASDVRAILSEVKKAAEDANRSNYDELAKSTTKSVVKNSAQIVAELLQAKVPALPALALKATWTDFVGTRSVLSDYSIAATAYKPLSFTWGNDLIDGRTVSFDRLDNLAARIIDKVKNKIPNIDNIEVKAINIADETVTVTGGTEKVTIPFSSINAKVNDALDITDLNNAIKDLIQLTKDAKSYADRAKSFEQRVSDFLEREINRVITKVSTDGLTRVLEPILVYQAGNFNVSRFFEGATVPAGEITLIPTTMTYEVLAPAYKKYVAVKKADGSFAVQKVLTKGDKDFNKVSVNLAAGNYTVIYSAVDFSGNQIAKKYNITVK